MAHSLYRPLLALALCAAAMPGGADARHRSAPRAHARPSARMAIVPAPADANGEHEFARANDGLFYVNAVVNGQPVRFLVDTGATIVVLTAADAARAGITPGEGGYSGAVETASGRAPMAWATLDHVQVAGRQLHGLRAAVMRQGLGVSLLGQNLLSRLGAVTIEGDRMRMR